jgi:MFS family permease
MFMIYLTGKESLKSLKIQPDTKGRKTESGLRIFHAEAATSSAEIAGDTYQTPALIAAGAGAQGVSLMSFFTNLVLAVLFIKAPGVAEKLGSTKKSVLVLALLSVVTWLPLILVFALFTSVNTAWLVGLWIFSLVPSTLLIPLRDGWLASLVPARDVGRYFGLRSVVAGIAYLVTFSLMGYILDLCFGQVFRGYAIILGIAFIASLGSLCLYRKIEASPEAGKEKVAFGFLDFLREMKGGNLGIFILFVSLFSLSVNLSSPLCAVYLLKNLNFSYLTYTLLVSVEYIARIASVTFWGRYADRAGSLKVLGIVSRLIPFIPVLWLFSSNLAYLVIIQTISGVIWAGFDLCSQTFIYKASPESKRLKYIGYYKSLVTLAMALGALSGAYLLGVVPPVFGSGILGMFLLSGILRLAIVRVMFHKLVDLAWVAPAVRAPANAGLTPVGGAAAKRGLFYRPEAWSLYLYETAPAEAGRALPTRRGLFNKVQAWASGLYETLSLRELVLPGAVATPAHGLFHKPEAWTSYHQETVPIKAGIEATPAHGLFHKPEAWASYRQETVPIKAGIEATPAHGLFHKPEAWASYRQETVPIKAGVKAKPAKGLFHKPEAWASYRQKVVPAKTQRMAGRRLVPALT